MGSSLPSRFADQYAPWAFGGDAVERDNNATLLRLALRQVEVADEGIAKVRTQAWRTPRVHVCLRDDPIGESNGTAFAGGLDW